MAEDKIYSLNDLIDLLQISRKTLIEYIKGGKIKAFRVGNAYRVTEESLQDYIEKTEVKIGK
jgi:excisionase family DNA binding protein